MKLKEVKQGEWTELSRYVDTVLVPVLPLSTIQDLTEEEHLVKLEQAAEVIEEKLKGRLLLWPTFTVFGEPVATLNRFSEDLNQKGFKYVCLVGSHVPEISSAIVLQLNLNDKEQDFSALSSRIVEKWSRFNSG